MHSNDRRLIEHARRRVGLKSALYTHAMVYALVNLGLAALSLYQGRQWFVGPLAGWGLGLLIHAIVTSVALCTGGPAGLRERWLRREIETLRQRQPH
jgi:hypothetical protein